jgi:hypothetical protein
MFWLNGCPRIMFLNFIVLVSLTTLISIFKYKENYRNRKICTRYFLLQWRSWSSIWWWRTFYGPITKSKLFN